MSFIYSQLYHVSCINAIEFKIGQNLHFQTATNCVIWFGTKLQFSWVIHYSTVVCSSGFAVETEEDQIIKGNTRKQRKISCGTEKGRHKSKNHRTAGN